jgi:hypothetical protein
MGLESSLLSEGGSTLGEFPEFPKDFLRFLQGLSVEIRPKAVKN